MIKEFDKVKLAALREHACNVLSDLADKRDDLSAGHPDKAHYRGVGNAIDRAIDKLDKAIELAGRKSNVPN